MHDRRLIEDVFPVREVSTESAKEKAIRHGHISTLHIWWARRPLAASRATAYAALVPALQDGSPLAEEREFIAKLAEWKSLSSLDVLGQARARIREAHGGRAPRVLDCFAGGGSIPLEALRLGCEVYALDYNPVAVLLLKAVLEYPQRFGRPSKLEREVAILGEKRREKTKVDNVLLEAVREWGEWVLNEARKELASFYPSDPDGSVPVGYLWARTIPCQNPVCGAEIPLMRHMWLAHKPNRRIALYPEVKGKTVRFRVVGTGYDAWPEGFDPDQGTVARAVATCLVCGGTVDDGTVRRLFREGLNGQRMLAVILRASGRAGKRYRTATEVDELVYREAEKALRVKQAELWRAWGIEPVPDEPTPEGMGSGAERAFSVRKYGMTRWGDLFNARQKLSLLTFTEKTRAVYGHLSREPGYEGLGQAVSLYLGLAVDRLADHNSTLQMFQVDKEAFTHTFGLQALPMVWDYLEVNPLEREGGWASSFRWLEAFLKTSAVNWYDLPAERIPSVTLGSATRLPWPDDFFDAVLTDPPYYDNVPYSDLSDFFYVWLKRSVGELYPELFVTPLTPKEEEMVVDASRAGGWELAKGRFETLLSRSITEIHRVLKPGGILVLVYAHQTTAGWETLVNALLRSGLTVTGSWPVSTEMQGRRRAHESAALASSVYIVARKVLRKETGFYTEVRDQLAQYLPTRLERFWKEGLSGPDLLIAGIGAGLEIFGKYREVLDYDGNPVRADRILDEVRALVSDFAVRQLLHNGLASELSELARFYLLYRWSFGEGRVEFDEARKLAQAVGLDLRAQWSRKGTFIRKEREWVRVLGPQERPPADLESASDLVDVLHRVLLLWERGERQAMVEVLSRTGWGARESFWRFAQAVSASLAQRVPNSKEKQLLDGLLTGRDRLREHVRERMKQGQLFS